MYAIEKIEGNVREAVQRAVRETLQPYTLDVSDEQYWGDDEATLKIKPPNKMAMNAIIHLKQFTKTFTLIDRDFHELGQGDPAIPRVRATIGALFNEVSEDFQRMTGTIGSHILILRPPRVA